ncbi:MAG: hypothetical protein LBC85_12680 [Fibromonadaceae bacterium]|nr:hypothetical protein [Fibromonadaceae bacterium]
MKVGKFILLLSISVFASITPGGYGGYSYTPTPNSLNQGEFGYAVRFGLVGGDNVSHSVAMRPLSFLELGVGINKDPIPAMKIILPFFDSLGQNAALGFSGKRWYFTGMLQGISDETVYGLTIAGIYDIDLHSPVGSIAGEIDLGYASLSVENFLYKNRYGAAATFTLKPLAAFDLPSYLEASTGASWRSPEHKEEKDFSAFFAIQAKAPIIQTEKEPLIYIDINPALDHSVTFVRDIYQLRFVFDMDAVLVAPFDFYMVGGISPSAKTKTRIQDSLVRRDIFDRCYLLWSSDVSPAWAAAGMLNSGIFGFQSQLTKKIRYNFNPVALIWGYTVGEQKGINAVGQVPLHPQFYGILSNSSLFAEGGLFLGENLAAQLNFRQGKEKKYLQIGSGYDFERKSVFGELSLQYDFSLSKQVSGATVRLAPNLRHRLNTPFYVFDYDVPIYQEGNNSRRLHNFPWKR